MSFGIALKVSGDFACFTRPEMKAERVSYDVMTPSAARGVLEAIYWKPGIRWTVDRIRVLNPIRFLNLRRNEVGKKLPANKIKGAMTRAEPLQLFIEDERQQRAALLLTDVAYVIEAHFRVLDETKGPPAKHAEMFRRRAARGQCFYQPFLGCREFPAAFEPADGNEQPAPELAGSADLGWMLHDLEFERDMSPRFFRTQMVDGVIEIPPFAEQEVRP